MCRKTRTFFLFLFLFAVLQYITACKAPEVRPDAAPQPSDPLINQARLEFKGCGYSSIVGTVGCIPGQTVQAVTEFPGKISFGTGGEGCELRDDMMANTPLTTIPTPRRPDGTSCAVTVIYTPTLPNTPNHIPQRSLFGEVLFLADNVYKYKGNLALSTFEFVNVKFPGAVRGAYASRQTDDPVRFDGDTLRFQPNKTGTDLILVKVWDEAGKAVTYSYTANYYSPRAQKLTYKLSTQDNKTIFKLDDAISAVTFDLSGKFMFNLAYQIPADYNGTIRGYTAQGRTIVVKFQNGRISWVK